MADFDVIVVGSGITGGWAAKEFCERGFKTLVIERGRNLSHPDPEYTDMMQPWELYNRGLMAEFLQEQGRFNDLREKSYPYWSQMAQFFVDEKEHPYSTPEGQPAKWVRGYQLGGRSLTWARQSYRWGREDFEANALDGHGIPWPIGYDDLAPWYDHVEAFAGISGAADNLDVLPDGDFLTPWKMSCAERHVAERLRENRPGRHLIMGRCANLTETRDVHRKLGRGPCQARSQCMQGCSFGAYFCSLSSTLPAARQTGNLTIVTDSIVDSVTLDQASGKATGVNVIDQNSKARRTYSARTVFLCASTFGSLQIMLNSTNGSQAQGLGNSSGMLGHYVMDHIGGAGARGTVPGYEDRYSFGRRPTGIYIPNFRHESNEELDFLRGYGYQGNAATRPRHQPTGSTAGIGAAAKSRVGKPRPWHIGIGMFGEMLPYYENQVSLHPGKTDRWGVPLLHIDACGRENEYKMLEHAARDAEDLLRAGGCIDVTGNLVARDKTIEVGARIHEMGGACMGTDPRASVLNQWSQSHDVPNLFVTDGACMSSCATQNPSLTYMAITARSADYAATQMTDGVL